MKDIGIVQGSAAQALPLVINGEVVYIHKDIKQIEHEDGAILYEYYEYQCTRDEYLQILAQENQEMMLAIAELGEMVGDTNG